MWCACDGATVGKKAEPSTGGYRRLLRQPGPARSRRSTSWLGSSGSPPQRRVPVKSSAAINVATNRLQIISQNLTPFFCLPPPSPPTASPLSPSWPKLADTWLLDASLLDAGEAGEAGVSASVGSGEDL